MPAAPPADPLSPSIPRSPLLARSICENTIRINNLRVGVEGLSAEGLGVDLGEGGPRPTSPPSPLASLRLAASSLMAGLWLLLAASPSLAEPPAPAKPTDAIQRWVHPTGATVILIERHDFPYATFDVTLRTGALWDPAGKAGLANFTAELMARGAGARDRAAIDSAFDRLGADLEIVAGQTGLSLEGDALARTLNDVVEILGDVVQRPTFEPGEFDKLKREIESDILRIRDNDQTLNRRFFKRYLYGAHPYGRPADGTVAGTRAITLDDVRAFYKAHFVARNVIVALSGDVTRAQAEAIVDRRVGALPRDQEAPGVTLPGLPTPTGRQVLLVDKPDRTQNQILLGHLSPDATSPDHYALEVANTIFGGTFTARLNHQVRDVRGLSYGAYSTLSSDLYAGSFSMWTFPSSQDGLKTVELLIELFEGLLAAPLTDEEVAFAREYRAGAFAFDIDTPAKLATEAVRAELEGRPADYLSTYVARINAVTTAQVNKAVQAHLDPRNFLLVMLCTAAGFEGAMKALPGVTTVKVVPYDQDF